MAHVAGYPRFPHLAAVLRFSPSTAWSLRSTVMEHGMGGPWKATWRGIVLEWCATMRSVTPDAEEIRLGRKCYGCYDEPEATHA